MDVEVLDKIQKVTLNEPAGKDLLEQRKTGAASEVPRLWLVRITLGVRAPDSWWNQARGYFTDIMWVRTNSTTKETLDRVLTPEDFEEEVPKAVLDNLNQLIAADTRSHLRTNLPASFIRRGIVHTNLSVLRDILRERGHYDDGHWAAFCEFLRAEQEIARRISTRLTHGGKDDKEND